MRRILVGLEVVRPRCAAGAPPRPRLAVHRPSTRSAEVRSTTYEIANGSTFTGVPNTDKGTLSPAGQPDLHVPGLLRDRQAGEYREQPGEVRHRQGHVTRDDDQPQGSSFRA